MSSSGRNRPLATIVIPTKDRPRLLERAVRSALAQTVADVQVVVVDDGSAEPGTLGIADPRLGWSATPGPLGPRRPATPACGWPRAGG